MGFTTILWHGTFSKTIRNSHISLTRHWNILVILGSKSLKFIICPVVVFSKVFFVEAAVNRTHNTLLSPGLRIHVCYPLSSQEKAVLSISVVTAEVRENSFLVPGSLSFWHIYIFCFLLKGFWELQHFKNLFILFLFPFY